MDFELLRRCSAEDLDDGPRVSVRPRGVRRALDGPPRAATKIMMGPHVGSSSRWTESLPKPR